VFFRDESHKSGAVLQSLLHSRGVLSHRDKVGGIGILAQGDESRPGIINGKPQAKLDVVIEEHILTLSSGLLPVKT
jgi:hypothetical protein